MRKLTMSVGNPVEGEECFWDRQEDLQLFTELLDAGAHVHLIAQRRMGKTSLIREVASLIKDRYVTLSVDLQDDKSPADAVAALSAATRPHLDLWSKVKDSFGNILSRVKEHVDSMDLSELTIHLRDGMVGEDWKERGDELFRSLASVEQGVVVFLDEVPILIGRLLRGATDQITPEGKRSADLFLSWLRENSIRHSGRVRVVVTGSIGLGPIIHRARLSATLNNFTPFVLKPWDESTAIGCLQALANQQGVTFTEGACEYMAQRLGCCIPHHVQTYFWLAYVRCRRRGDLTFSAVDAEQVYQEDMLGVNAHGELLHYEERLFAVLGKRLATVALAILTEVAQSDGITYEQVQSICRTYSFEDCEELPDILEVLEHDGYLALGPDKTYRFVSSFLCDWWRKRFGLLG